MRLTLTGEVWELEVDDLDTFEVRRYGEGWRGTEGPLTVAMSRRELWWTEEKGTDNDGHGVEDGSGERALSLGRSS